MVLNVPYPSFLSLFKFPSNSSPFAIFNFPLAKDKSSPKLPSNTSPLDFVYMPFPINFSFSHVPVH